MIGVKPVLSIFGRRTFYSTVGLNGARSMSSRTKEVNDYSIMTQSNLKNALERPFKENVDKLQAMPYPWSKLVEFKNIEAEIKKLDSLERDVLCRLWLSHRSFGSDNHIAHAAVCGGTNMIACALAGLPLREYSRVDEVAKHYEARYKRSRFRAFDEKGGKGGALRR